MPIAAEASFLIVLMLATRLPPWSRPKIPIPKLRGGTLTSVGAPTRISRSIFLLMSLVLDLLKHVGQQH
jgi:hypothetical protein